jgi:hypothetical protein
MSGDAHQQSRAGTGGSETSRNFTPGRILVAFEKLFGGGRGVEKFPRSGLRYVQLTGGALLIEQNPKKKSEWGELARAGRRVAWVMREGQYLARVVDGEVVMLD